MGIKFRKEIEFRKNVKVEIIRLTENEIEFDMIGIEFSLAEELLRILVQEVPSMAIDLIALLENTSETPDILLCRNLFFSTIDADPRLFEYMSENDMPNERNVIVYKLDVSCKEDSPHIIVKSDQLKWLPNGSENDDLLAFSRSQNSLPGISGKPLGVKQDDVILAKLRPGQTIKLEAHAVKGNGKVGRKWSPVIATRCRRLPKVVLSKEIKGKDAEALVEKCAVNVFDIEDLGRGDKKAVVANPRACTLCKNCVQGAGAELVELGHVEDHIIFTIKSRGALSPKDLFIEAVKILEEKCGRLIAQLS